MIMIQVVLTGGDVSGLYFKLENALKCLRLGQSSGSSGAAVTVTVAIVKGAISLSIRFRRTDNNFLKYHNGIYVPLPSADSCRLLY